MDLLFFCIFKSSLLFFSRLFYCIGNQKALFKPKPQRWLSVALFSGLERVNAA